ncbi:MAG: sulfurtransferase [Proteobacteria bacterium]|nr:sulfurtransferase [Pseudomonadota bacterium]
MKYFLVVLSIFSLALTLSAEPMPGTIITAEELKKYIDSKKTKIIDVRNIYEYISGHIPGAVHINNKEFEDPDNPVGGMIAPAKQIEALMSANGIITDDLVVIYAADQKPQMATRLLWVLKVYRHQKVQILNGHYKAWIIMDYPVERGTGTRPAPSIYKTGIIDSSCIATKKDCLFPSENTVLLDVRTQNEYTGEKVSKSAARGGHIPGAVNIYYLNAVDDRGYFKDVPTLISMYAAAGVTPDKNVIVYCMRAHRASHTYFVLTSLLGFSNVRVYDGSWIEWSNLPELPVSIGQSG